MMEFAWVCLGVALGWTMRAYASTETMRLMRERFQESAGQNALLRETIESIVSSHREEREHLLHHLVSMRRLGFVPVDDGDDEGEGSWTIDNAYEAEVSEARRKQRASEDEVRADHADVIQDLGQSLHARPGE